MISPPECTTTDGSDFHGFDGDGVAGDGINSEIPNSGTDLSRRADEIQRRPSTRRRPAWQDDSAAGIKPTKLRVAYTNIVVK